jgi:hypothetical protein
MGRYAMFSTNFEYKFWFALQDSGFDFLSGVIRFDDQTTYHIDEDYDTECDSKAQQQINEEFKEWALDQMVLTPDAYGYKPEYADNMALCESDSTRNCSFELTDQDKSNLLDWINKQGHFVPDWTKYSSDCKGTEALYDDLWKHELFNNLNTDKTNETEHRELANYMLGLVLYHQMTYAPGFLDCTYDC